MCVSLKQLILKFSKNLLNEVGVRPGGFREIFLFKKLSFICETVKIMANIKLSFLNEKHDDDIVVFCNASDDIYISINDDDIGSPYNSAFIALDVETAVKFAKELRRQIAIAKDNIQYQKEQENG